MSQKPLTPFLLLTYGLILTCLCLWDRKQPPHDPYQRFRLHREAEQDRERLYRWPH